MTVMWFLRRLIRCLIRRKEGEHRGTWGKDVSRGGGAGSGNPSLVPLPVPMPENISAGSLPALNLLFDPRGLRFGVPHYQVLLQHWAQLGWVKHKGVRPPNRWRRWQGKFVCRWRGNFP